MRLDLVPDEVDLELYAGDGVSLALSVTDASGNPINLTGTVMAQIRQNRTDGGVPSISFTVDMTNAASGQLALSLTGTQTANLTTGTADPYRGSWDVQWTATSGQPRTLVQGSIVCLLDVSR